MLEFSELGPRIIIYFGSSHKVFLTESTCLQIILAIVIGIVGIWMGSGLKKVPKGKQVFAEALVGWAYDFAANYLGKKNGEKFAPYLGSLIVWLIFANSTGLLGLRPVTADLNVTAALALMSFLIIQGAAIKQLGIKGRIDELGDPFYGIIPMSIISELVMPVTLALRLFGNIFGGMVVIELWLKLMEYLSLKFFSLPILRCITVIPLNLFFDIFEPLIQAYIFVVLTAASLGEGLSGMSEMTAAKRRLKNEAKLQK